MCCWTRWCCADAVALTIQTRVCMHWTWLQLPRSAASHRMNSRWACGIAAACQGAWLLSAHAEVALSAESADHMACMLSNMPK